MAETSIVGHIYVLLKDQSGKKVAIFDGTEFTALSFTKTVDDIGSYTLTLNGNDSRRNLFELDGQVEVYRKIPGVIDWYLEFEGLHRRADKALNEDGSVSFISVGVGYNDMLARTVIAYKQGTIRAAKNCSAETAMKEYVYENCILGDATVVGRLAEGSLPGFSVEPDKTSSAGFALPNWAGDKAYENLMDVLKEIATLSGIDFAVVGNGPAKFLFETYLQGMGKNKTYGAMMSLGRNEYGNIPVVLAAVFGGISSATYTNDRLAESNVVIVQGQGDGSTKHTVTRTDPEAINDSPWNRREVSRSSSSSDFEYQLKDFGDQTLKELAGKEQISDCVPLQTPSSLYGKDYHLGDNVTVWFDDVKMNKRIVSVTLDYGDNGETITMELADTP